VSQTTAPVARARPAALVSAATARCLRWSPSVIDVSQYIAIDLVRRWLLMIFFSRLDWMQDKNDDIKKLKKSEENGDDDDVEDEEEAEGEEDEEEEDLPEGEEDFDEEGEGEGEGEGDDDDDGEGEEDDDDA